MCLSLNEKSKIVTAKKDIVVYKRVRQTSCRTIEEINDGDEFTGYIEYEECSGKIHKTSGGVLFFCTKNSNLDGKPSPEKFGYDYSWVLDGSVKSVIVNGVELIRKITIKALYETPYRDFQILIGETYTSELVRRENNVYVGIHSFEALSAARADGGGEYVKCIIPKGSKYYKGTFGSSVSYASDKLTYVEIIN